MQRIPSTIRSPWLCPLMLVVLIVCPKISRGDDWMTWASSYTHEPMSGQRVDQYAQPVAPIAQQRADFVRSGYRHYRSTLQTGQSADNLHVVEQWGRQVVPYEHWRFPYRPYGVPYDAWGPQAPYGIFNGSINSNYPGYAGPGYAGGPAYGNPASGNGTPSNPPPSVGGPGQGTPGYGAPGYGAPGYGAPGYGAPGYGAPGYGAPGYGAPGYGAPPPAVPRGFPLTPEYRNEPWYDGTYPSPPPLDPRSDAEFFYRPTR